MKLSRPLLSAATALVFLVTACGQPTAPKPDADLSVQALPQGRATDLASSGSGVYAVGVIGIDEDDEYTGTEAFVRKYDRGGNRVWSKRFGTLPNQTGATSAASDALGNLYVGGYAEEALPGAVGTGGSFLRKYTPSGAVAWTRQGDHPVGSLATFGKALYAVGSVPNVNAGDAYLRRYDAAGNRIWTRRFGTSGRDVAGDVAVSDTGFVYVVGSAAGPLAPGSGSGGLFVRKFNPSGGVMWTKQFDLQVPYFYGMAVAVNGSNVYVLGSHISSIYEGKSAVYKLNTSGGVVWSKAYTPQSDGSFAYLEDLNADRTGVYLTGKNYFDTSGGCYGQRVYLGKLRPDGTTAWETRLALGTEWSGGVTVLARSTNEVYVGGWADAWMCDDASYGNFYVGRADGATGRPVWER